MVLEVPRPKVAVAFNGILPPATKRPVALEVLTVPFIVAVAFAFTEIVGVLLEVKVNVDPDATVSAVLTVGVLNVLETDTSPTPSINNLP
ncbi:hypothetical protein MCEGE10_02912 [Flavobacteriaceae bacterium]